MIQATNNFIFVVRDVIEGEKDGFFIPDQGREKPPTGEIISVGELVQDKKIKSAKNKKCMFHKGVGMPIEYEGVEYLVLEDRQIIALV